MGYNMAERALPYYKWFWQDWRSNRTVQRMNYIHRGLYRELLDECWVEGGFQDSIESMADICGCPDDVMADAWQVLSKCFILLDGVWHNEKLDSLRTERDQVRLKRSAAGRSGGIAKSLKEKDEEANAKQIVANASKCHIEEAEKRREEGEAKEEKIARKVRSVSVGDLVEQGVPEQVASDWMAIRKAKRAPLTQTAFDSIKREAGKAGMTLAAVITICVERGWQSFNSGWVVTADRHSGFAKRDYHAGVGDDGSF